MTGSWRPAVCTSVLHETGTARSIRLRVADLGEILPGQHIDIRLTADDGYQAVRSYSLSAVPGGSPRGRALAADEVELTVEELPDGEVSPYLVEGLEVGDELEIRGPIGGWFVWHEADPDPVLLIGGGSGVAPLMAMLRARVSSGSVAPFRLLSSVRSPESLYYADELAALAEAPDVDVDVIYTRAAPVGWVRQPGRITAGDLESTAQDPGAGMVFVCGPNSFVATITDLLIARGHDPATIRTERFGGV